MRKKMTLILTALLLVVSLSACGSKDNQSAEADQSDSKVAADEKAEYTKEADQSDSKVATDEKMEYTEEDYQKAVANFKEVKIDEVLAKIEKKEDFVLYVGRQTCPYCVKLAPGLDAAKADLGVDIYYLDSEKTNETMDKFFDDYKLEYVPSLLNFSKGEGKEVKLDHDYAKNHTGYPMDKVVKDLKAELGK